MLICKVKGTIVSSNKNEKLTGMKLMVIQPIDVASKKESGTPIIAVDTVGAGKGEVVLTVSGSSSRQTAQTENRPVDHAIIGIIDSVEIDGTVVFRKSDENN